MSNYFITGLDTTLNDTVSYLDLGQLFLDICNNQFVSGFVSYQNNPISKTTYTNPSHLVNKAYVDTVNSGSNNLIFQAVTFTSMVTPVNFTNTIQYSTSVQITNKDITFKQNNLYNAVNSDQIYTFGAGSRSNGGTMGGGMWVMGGQGTYTLAYSYDGINWYPAISSPFTGYCNAVGWNGSMWVAMGSGGSYGVAYSYDGINWIGCMSLSLWNPQVQWGCSGNFVWNGIMWLAYSCSNISNVNFIYSYDGIQWYTNGTGGLVSMTNWSGQLAWNGTIFVLACGGQPSSRDFQYSYDGLKWTYCIFANGAGSQGGYVNAVAWNGSIWSAPGSGNYSYWSRDGMFWFTVLTNWQFNSGPSCNCIWTGTMFLAVSYGNNYNMAYAYTGMNDWTPYNNPIGSNGLSMIAYNGTMFIAPTFQNPNICYYGYTGSFYTFRDTANLWPFTTRGLFACWGGRKENVLYLPQSRTLALGSGIYASVAYSFDGSANWIGGNLVTSWGSGNPTNYNTYTNSSSMFSSGNGAAWNGSMWVAAGTPNNIPQFTTPLTITSSLNFGLNTPGTSVSYFSVENTGFNYPGQGTWTNTSWTMEAWIRLPNTIPNSIDKIMGIAGVYASNFQFGTSTTNGYLTVGGASIDDNRALNDFQWHYVAATVNSGITNGSFYYIDGVQRPKPFTSTLVTSNYMNPFTIGTFNNLFTNQRNFVGEMAEIRVWNYALSPSQIALQWQTNVSPSANGLVAYFNNFPSTGTITTNYSIMNNGLKWAAYAGSYALAGFTDATFSIKPLSYPPYPLSGSVTVPSPLGSNVSNFSYQAPNNGANTGITSDFTNISSATNGNFVSNQNHHQFSVQWTGVFYAQASGSYSFTITGLDDYAMFWIGDNAKDGYYTNTNYNLAGGGTYTVSLNANTYYLIRLIYSEWQGGYNIVFYFTPPGGSAIYNGTGYYFQNYNNDLEIISGSTLPNSVKNGPVLTLTENGTNSVTYDIVNKPVLYNYTGNSILQPQHSLAYSTIYGNTILGNAGNLWIGMGNYTFSVSANNIAWNGNVWVAVGQGLNTLAYSPDGFTWFGLGSNTFYNWGNSLAWNGTFWVAVGQGANTMAYSQDGVQWTGLGNSTFAISGNGVNWNGTMWVATGSGANTMAYSLDAVNWTGLGNRTFFVQGNDVASNVQGTMWVAAGKGGDVGQGNVLAWSPDGINWNKPTGNIWSTQNIFSIAGTSVVHNGKYWIASGQGGNTLAYSSDGNTWTGEGNSAMTYYANRVVWNQGLGSTFFKTNYSTSTGLTLTNGASSQPLWIAAGSPYGTTPSGAIIGNTLGYSRNGFNWFGLGNSVFYNAGQFVAYNGTIWVAGGQGANTIAYSYNGVTWTGIGSKIFSTKAYFAKWNGAIWVAVGQGGNSIGWSQDGINWTGLGAGIFSYGTAVEWNGMMWIAGGNNSGFTSYGNTLAYSFNGTNWIGLGGNAFALSCNSISWNGYMWLGIGGSANWNGSFGASQGNTLAYSLNGFNWFGQGGQYFSGPLSNAGYGQTLAYNGRTWVAGGFNGFGNTWNGTNTASQVGNTMLFSTNGFNWNTVPGSTTIFMNACYNVKWDGKMFIAGGQGYSTGQGGGNTLAFSYNGNSWLGLGNTVFTGNVFGIACKNLFGNKIQLDSNMTNRTQALEIVSDTAYQSGHTGLSVFVNARPFTNAVNPLVINSGFSTIIYNTNTYTIVNGIFGWTNSQILTGQNLLIGNGSGGAYGFLNCVSSQFLIFQTAIIQPILVYQSIYFNPGTYTLSFFAAPRYNNNISGFYSTTQQLTATIGNYSKSTTFTSNTNPWTQYTLNFTISTADNYILQFSSYNTIISDSTLGLTEIAIF